LDPFESNKEFGGASFPKEDFYKHVIKEQPYVLSFFKKSILEGIFPSNQHLLVLNGHGSHVMLKALEQAQ